MRLPLITRKSAANCFNSFNWKRRLNHRVLISRLNRDQANKLFDSRFDEQPNVRYNHKTPKQYCDPCLPEISKSKLYNRDPRWGYVKKKECGIIVIATITHTTLKRRITLNEYNNILENKTKNHV